MGFVLLVALGIAGGFAVCVAAARVPNAWARAAIVGASFLLPWYAFLPLLARLFPHTDPGCSFICISDGEAYGVLVGLAWCGGTIAGALVVGVWRIARRIADPRPPRPPAGLRIAELAPEDAERVARRLPLTRRQTAQTYLVAWDGDEPVGHVHVKWRRTRTAGVPDIEDLVGAPGIEQSLVEAAERLIYERASK